MTKQTNTKGTHKRRNPLGAKKRFGQNFLSDEHVIHEIIRSFAPQKDDHVVEIGPGRGALTQHLMGKTASLTLIELDRDLVSYLSDRYLSKAGPSLRMIEQDALKLDLAQVQQDLDLQAPVRIIGNLPYNISSPLLFHLISQLPLIQDMTLMLQKEVVDRITASPHGPAYGKLSVMCQYFLETQALLDVPPESFTPQPKVNSAILKATPHQQKPHPDCDINTLNDLVSHAFNQRRKQIRNALSNYFDEASLKALNVDPSLRAQNLDIHTFIKLANAYTERQAQAPSQENAE